MLEIIFGIGVLDIQVAIIGENPLNRHFPGMFVLFSIVPPCDASGKSLELQGLRLGIIVAAFW